MYAISARKRNTTSVISISICSEDGRGAESGQERGREKEARNKLLGKTFSKITTLHTNLFYSITHIYNVHISNMGMALPSMML